MCFLSDSTRPVSLSSIPSQDGDLTSAFTGQEAYQEIIKKAEAISITKVFRHYGINLDQYNRKSTCPFLKHKGGRESTASLYFYPETNTFWCFGCKTGTTTVDFVANLERCNKVQAAIKLLNLFNGEVDLSVVDKKYKDSYQEKVNLLFEFSKKIREIIASNPAAQMQIEEICKSFDKMNDKYELEPSALQALIEKINLRIDKIV